MQKIRKLLIPFAWLYGLILWGRNKCYDWGWLSATAYDFPVVCVGNLSVGGTGKSPMIEYLMALLKDQNKVATLSRGYKRSTKGFYVVKGDENANAVGDEPLQFKTNYPELPIAVCEDRRKGIAYLREMTPKPTVVLLDDAFQHRRVKPGFSILLTTYDALYKDDLILPAGNLREPKSGAKRAQIIVVSKCPVDVSDKEKQKIQAHLNLPSFQSLYFSTISYADYFTNGGQKISLDAIDQFCLVTGIAKPEPLVDYLKSRGAKFNHRRFGDHHNFSNKEIEELKNESFIVTTEKDFMRLKSRIPLDRLFYLPIRQKIIGEGKAFDQEVINLVENLK